MQRSTSSRRHTRAPPGAGRRVPSEVRARLGWLYVRGAGYFSLWTLAQGVSRTIRFFSSVQFTVDSSSQFSSRSAPPLPLLASQHVTSPMCTMDDARHAGAPCLWPEPVSVCAQPSAGAGYPLARGRRLAAPLEPESRSGRTEEINFTRTYLAITLYGFTYGFSARASNRRGILYTHKVSTAAEGRA